MNSQHNKNKTKKLSILHLVYTMGLGGIEISTAKLALDQKERGCDVTVVCLFYDGCIGEELKAKGIEVIALNLRRGRGMLNLFGPLNRICKQRKPDVIHIHTRGTEPPVAIVILRQRIKKSISTIRAVAQYRGWRKLRARFYNKLSSLCCNHIVAVSHAVKEHEIHNLGRNPDKITVIWNGVDTKLFYPNPVAPAERAQALGLKSIEQGTFVVGMGAQLEEFKDIPTLIRTARRIKEQTRKNVLFVIAGAGSLEEHLKNLATELGVKESLKFVGRIKDMPRFLNAIDLLALTSPFEGLPTIVLEAMAVGIPVVTTDAGGVRDCVTDGQTGIIVPVGDDKTLAQAIIKLIDDRKLAHRMGQAGLSKVRRHLTIEQYTQSYWDLITKRNT